MLPGQYIFAFFVTSLKAGHVPQHQPPPPQIPWSLGGCLDSFLSPVPYPQGHPDIIRKMDNFNLGSLEHNFNLKKFTFAHLSFAIYKAG